MQRPGSGTFCRELRSILYQECFHQTAGGEFQNTILILNADIVIILARNYVFWDGDIKIVGFRLPIHMVKFQRLAEVRSDILIVAAQHFSRNLYGQYCPLLRMVTFILTESPGDATAVGCPSRPINLTTEMEMIGIGKFGSTLRMKKRAD